MFHFREKKRRVERLIYSKVTLSLLLVVAAFLSMSVWGVYQKERGTEKVREERAAELSELRDREGVIRTELERLSTESGVEAEIRKKFEVGKEGEQVVVIVDADSAPQEEAAAEGSGWFRRFLSFFGL